MKRIRLADRYPRDGGYFIDASSPMITHEHLQLHASIEAPERTTRSLSRDSTSITTCYIIFAVDILVTFDLF